MRRGQRCETTQREIKNRMKTIVTPIKIPMTTHKRRKKIDVCLESCVFKNVPSKIDIVAGKWIGGDTGLRWFRWEMR